MSSFKFNSDGFLYWEIGIWSRLELNTKPMEIIHGSYTDWNTATWSNDYNGDGTLVLPGPERIVPTLRLVNYRDAIEDYEYYKILENLSNNPMIDPGLKQQAETLLEVNPEIIGNVPIEHTYNPDLVYEERRRVAELIVQLIEGNEPGFKIESPNGGESWVKNNTQQIEWVSFGEIEYINIEFSVDDCSLSPYLTTIL